MRRENREPDRELKSVATRNGTEDGNGISSSFFASLKGGL